MRVSHGIFFVTTETLEIFKVIGNAVPMQPDLAPQDISNKLLEKAAGAITQLVGSLANVKHKEACWRFAADVKALGGRTSKKPIRFSPPKKIRDDSDEDTHSEVDRRPAAARATSGSRKAPVTPRVASAKLKAETAKVTALRSELAGVQDELQEVKDLALSLKAKLKKQKRLHEEGLTSLKEEVSKLKASYDFSGRRASADTSSKRPRRGPSPDTQHAFESLFSPSPAPHRSPVRRVPAAAAPEAPPAWLSLLLESQQKQVELLTSRLTEVRSARPSPTGRAPPGVLGRDYFATSTTTAGDLSGSSQTTPPLPWSQGRPPNPRPAGGPAFHRNAPSSEGLARRRSFYEDYDQE